MILNTFYSDTVMPRVSNFHYKSLNIYNFKTSSHKSLNIEDLLFKLINDHFRHIYLRSNLKYTATVLRISLL